MSEELGVVRDDDDTGPAARVGKLDQSFPHHRDEVDSVATHGSASCRRVVRRLLLRRRTR